MRQNSHCVNQSPQHEISFQTLSPSLRLLELGGCALRESSRTTLLVRFQSRVSSEREEERTPSSFEPMSFDSPTSSSQVRDRPLLDFAWLVSSSLQFVFLSGFFIALLRLTLILFDPKMGSGKRILAPKPTEAPPAEPKEIAPPRKAPPKDSGSSDEGQRWGRTQGNQAPADGK